MINPTSICISRTDSIGDVLLTLPMCGLIKQKYPNCKIIFLGKSYTKAVINCSEFVDHFLDWDALKSLSTPQQDIELSKYGIDTFIHVFPVKEIVKLAKKVRIPHRISNARSPKLYMRSTHRLNFTRRNSDLHEAQLNVKLLAPLGINLPPNLSDLWPFTGFKNTYNIPSKFAELTTKNKTVILHPKSQGSAVEWGIDNFIALANHLAQVNYTVLFCGTEKEGQMFRHQIPAHPNIHDLTGKLTLEEYIALIAHVKGLVAASTGPLHIASLLQIKAVGLYSSRRPIHPGRWCPIGPNSTYLVFDANCESCKKGENCSCVENISVQQVHDALDATN